MEEIIEHQIRLLDELRNLSHRIEKKDVVDILPPFLSYTVDTLTRDVHTYNIKNHESYQATSYYLEELSKLIIEVPDLKSGAFLERNDFLNKDYYNKYEHYLTEIPDEKGVNDSYCRGDFEEPDTFISFVGANVTYEAMCKFYPSYLDQVEKVINKVCVLFKVDRVVNSEVGYRSLYYDPEKLKVIYNEYKMFIDTTEAHFISIMQGNRTTPKIKVNFPASNLNSFIHKMYPPGEVSIDCQIAKVTTLFTDKKGNPFPLNGNKSRSDTFNDKLNTFFKSL